MQQAATLSAASMPVQSHADSRAQMQAIIATGYGDSSVLRLVERPVPVPKENEVLVRVVASNVTAADTMLRRGTPKLARLFLGLTKPKAAISGTGVAGVVEAVGKNVMRFSVGDAVFGEAGLNFGAHAQYVCVSQDGVLLRKPEALSFADAATLCDGPLTSYNFLQRLAQVKAGDKVLINGAAGALGTAAVQLARHFGAEVTAVCSGRNAELVCSLGAHHVIDYTQQDFTERHGEYDVIYDTVGKSSFSRCRRALRNGGAYLTPVFALPQLFVLLWTLVWGDKKMKFDATGMRPAGELRPKLERLAEMATRGQLRTITERTCSLAEIPAAHDHIDQGHKRGNIVVRVD